MSTPVIVVLCSDPQDRPGHLLALGDQVTWRFTDAAGLGDAVDGAQALLLWDFFSTAVAEVWPRCTDLSWIHVAAAGVDKLLFDGLRTSDVVVTNAHGTFDRPIAEYVLACVLAHAKRLHESADLQRRHEWRHRETSGVTGARALVVGTGGIGREIARLLGAVGMQVRGAGRRPAQDDPDFGDIVDSAALPEHCGDVDYLINATPLTPATTGLLDAAVFTALPETAFVVNIGRGASLVEDDLLAALNAGSLSGAALDVFAREPLPADSPLWDAPGLVVSPHLSGDQVGWRDTLARQFVDNARRWLAGQPLHGVVDTRLGYVPGTPPAAPRFPDGSTPPDPARG